MISRLVKAGMISGELAQTVAMNLNDRQRALDEEGAQTTEEEMAEACNFAALAPLPAVPAATLKRQRSELAERAETSKLARVCTQIPQPQRERDPRIRARAAQAPRVVSMDTPESGPSRAPPSQPTTTAPTSFDAQPSTSFADAAKTSARRDHHTDSARPNCRPPPPPPGPAAAPTATTATRKPRYPPLVVETLPNWAYHLRQLKAKLGRTPNARPFGKGIKFTPTEETEYRTIQRYLSDLEKSERISWFSYSLPQEKSLKIAIRGVPVDTDPQEISEDLRTLGFEPELVRPIKARKGRPGCIYFAIIKRTPELTPAIYQVSELLCMPGVHIESWRGKKGPAQCHRCQKFRHSSHNCHRKQACVRCGDEHNAHECPRPKEEAATCANCGGPHPANNLSCPIFRREARNKRAGTVAETTKPKIQAATKETEDIDERPAPAGSNIRTPANDPTPRGAKPKRKRRSKPKTAGQTTTTAPSSAAPPAKDVAQATTQATKTTHSRVIDTAIQILSDVLLALRAGEEPVDVILRGMGNLIKLNG